MRFCKYGFIALLLLVLGLLPVTARAVEIGTQAPDFRLKSLQGQEVGLADFKGQLVLLKLATTWCPTCRQLTAEISKLGEFLKERDVVVIEVFVQDSPAMVRQSLGDHRPPMAFHALLDDGQVYKAYSVYLIPRLLVIDAGQVVRFDSAGRNVTADEIMAMVKAFTGPSAGAPSS